MDSSLKARRVFNLSSLRCVKTMQATMALYSWRIIEFYDLFAKIITAYGINKSRESRADETHQASEYVEHSLCNW